MIANTEHSYVLYVGRICNLAADIYHSSYEYILRTDTTHTDGFFRLLGSPRLSFSQVFICLPTNAISDNIIAPV
jgi:hypothetical protein